MRAENRRGFVLVEAIALLGMGTMALGLVFPQIQAAREAARRAQCVNNLKQLGLAMHNYNDANGSFPMSAVLGKGHGNGHSGFSALLPYLEQTAAYNSCNYHLEKLA